MKIRGKILAAAAVPVMAAGVGLTVGGSAQAGTQAGPPAGYTVTAPVPIGYSVTANSAVADNITGITGTFGTPAASVVGPAAVQVPLAGVIQFRATDSQGAAITWSSTAALPTGFALTSAGALTLPATAVTAPVAFTVQAADGSAVALATVHVGVGATATAHGVWVTPDTVALRAPRNANGKVIFATVPYAGVTETLAHGPAGAVFRHGVLSAGRAVPGYYGGVVVTAKDAAGATATEVFNAAVRPVYAPIPRLSGGHAVALSPTRENVYFIQSGAPSWVHFTIVGPGGINGHQGWVYGKLGLNVGVYWGLLPHHGYAVYFQPVTGQGSTTPVPGSHWGYVYFVS